MDRELANEEVSEFPILCETCLGPNPFVRMQRAPHGNPCKICDRPFTVFRWKPGGQDARYKKTEVCQTCCKMQNVCQTCLFDLEYGLPVEVRDKLLREGGQAALQGATGSSTLMAIPSGGAITTPVQGQIVGNGGATGGGGGGSGSVTTLYAQQPGGDPNAGAMSVQPNVTAMGMMPGRHSNVMREYYNDMNEREVSRLAPGQGRYDKVAPNNGLLALARPHPYYKRNRTHLCRFFAKGLCNRGDLCPYRHEMPENNELSEQKLKDRFYGVNDPVAKKMLDRYQERVAKRGAAHDSASGSGGSSSGGSASTDTSNRHTSTLFVGGLNGSIGEPDLRQAFEPFGELKSVTIVSRQSCAFVAFVSRTAAEHAAKALANRLTINGARLKVLWGHARPAAKRHASQKSSSSSGGSAGADDEAPTLADPFQIGGATTAHYPSMSSQSIGSSLRDG